MAEVAPGHVAVARVLGPWGLNGAIKVEPLAPAGVLLPGRKLWAAAQQREIMEARPSGRFVRVKLSGIDDRENAGRLRGHFLELPESELDPLPEGEYYRFQLLGLVVRGSDGTELGRVSDILAAPENDVYIVQGPDGQVLIPAVDDVVLNVDLGKKVITVEIVPGLLP